MSSRQLVRLKPGALSIAAMRLLESARSGVSNALATSS
jgi:hypothetical protein